jgi:hypothetical protein
MSNSGGIIRQPVRIRDLQEIFSTSLNNIGSIISSNNININKWAWYKPVVIPNNVGVISEQERKDVKYGLVPTKNNLIASVLRKSSTNTPPTETEFNNAKSASTEWTYNKPSGNLSAPYRLTDFVCKLSDGRGDTGYYKDTEPPLMLKKHTWNILLEDLKDAANWTVVETSSSGTSWKAIPYKNVGSGDIDSGQAVKGYGMYSVYGFLEYKAKFGTSSNQNINQPSSYVIPLNWLLDDASDMFNGNWRMAFAVFVPGIPNDNINPINYCSFFTSQQALSDTYSDTQEMINAFSVDLCTNQVLARKMAAYVEHLNTDYSFNCIPFMAKFGDNTFSINGGGTSNRTFQLVSNNFSDMNFEAYNFPTGETEFKIKVSAGSSSDDSEADGWKLQRFYVGMTGEAASANRRSLFCIAIVDTSGLSRTVSFKFYAKFTYSYQSGTTMTNNYEGTVTWDPGQTFTVNNTTYTGRTVIPTNRELNIVNIEVFRIVYG